MQRAKLTYLKELFVFSADIVKIRVVVDHKTHHLKQHYDVASGERLLISEVGDYWRFGLVALNQA